MRFFCRMQDNIDRADFGMPKSVHRMSEDFAIMERYDLQVGAWVDNPDLIRFCGIGGDEDYVEVSEDEALNAIDALLEGMKDST